MVAVRRVGHVVEGRHVDRPADREPAQQLLAAPRAALALPLADHVGDRQHDLLAVTEDGGVDEVGDRLGVERRVTARDHERVVVATVDGVQRDAGQVERGEQIRIAELGRERDAEHVERTHRAMAVDGELRDGAGVVAGAHHGLEVGPHGVGALGQDPVPLVEHLVEDRDALVGEADLVRVGVHQRPADVDRVPVLHGRVELSADVLDRLLDRRKLGLEPGEDRRDGHDNTSRDLGNAGCRTSPAYVGRSGAAHSPAGVT